MTREQRERVGLWIRWALALALIPTIAAIDGHYAKQSDLEAIRVLLLRIDSNTNGTAKRVSKMFCASLPADKQPGCPE